MIPPRIKNVLANDNYELIIEYENGQKKKYNMKPLLNESFYNSLNNIAYFKLAKSAQVTVEWPNGEDIDPNELYNNSEEIT